MFDIDPALVAVFIPIIVVFGVFAAVITQVVVSGRHKELEHKERIMAMEKGIPIPEPPREERKRRRPRYLTIRLWGFIMFAFGIAFGIALGAEIGARHGLWGLIAVFMGAALLFAAAAEKKDVGLSE